MDTSRTAIGVAICAAGVVGTYLCLRGRATRPFQEQFQSPVATVSKLYLYPVKSCRRVEVDSIECWKRGLKYDRTFLVVDATGQFLTQRQCPTMALVQPHIEVGSEEKGESLRLTAPGMEEIEVRVPSEDCKPTDTPSVWKLSGEAVHMGEELSRWFSRYLGKDGCQVYYMSSLHKARLLRDWKLSSKWDDVTKDEDETSFSDFAPLLILSEASMELLNTKLKEPLEIERFRPNIIVKDCPAHAEDDWTELRIGKDLIVRNMKPCTRCRMIKVDPERGVVTGQEPMETLAKYRYHSMVYSGVNDKRFTCNPMFGCHYAVDSKGTIRVNDVVFARST